MVLGTVLHRRYAMRSHPKEECVRRLTLSQRIAAVGCLVMLTVTVALFYFITSGFSKDIAFATFEKYGNQYQRPLEDLLENVSQHQLLARRYLTGDQSVSGPLNVSEAAVDAALEKLRVTDTEIGTALQFTDEGLA